VPLPGNLRYARALRRLERVVAKVLARPDRACGEQDDLLSLMLSKSPDGPAMDPRLVRDNIITFLLAGHETTALALSWTLYLLSQHPDIDARVAAEVSALP